MRPQVDKTAKNFFSPNRRVLVWYGALLVVVAIFIARLFYLQIIRHDYYHTRALADQLKEYKVDAPRGLISAHDGASTVPIVLDETRYTLYADPSFAAKNADSDAQKLTGITHGDVNSYSKLIKTPNSRYVILAKRLSKQQNDQITALKLAGIGTQAQNYRNYPQGSLAAQLLGFVNEDGKGTYGVEQALNGQLSGMPGELKAITDASGVPLAASRDNIQVDPKAGSDVVLTVDVAMQKQLETVLKNGLERAKSKSGSALIMDPNSGAVLAMANYPTYDPSQYYKVSDANVFNNSAVSSPLEVGSIMKTLTASAALDQGAIKPNTSYYDPSHWPLDGHEITNIEEDGGAGTHNIADILNLSINTGATWMLMQMGGQTGQVSKTARDKWHDYMTNHFQLGKKTGIEQGYEATGYIPDPDKGYALQLTYANTSFGQAMTATPLQMAAAISSVVNGGIYYQPHLVDKIVTSGGQEVVNKPKVVNNHVVSPEVSKQMQSLMEYVVQGHLKTGFSYLNFPSEYIVGGKTGTAQIADPKGGYYGDKYNGTYMGFVGGDKPQYVIVVRVNTPGVGGYAGSQAAQPLFADLAHMLINNFNVTPKSGT
jgi:stage V sporulation protein D (sporulation-specific penicillin-binding protein)